MVYSGREMHKQISTISCKQVERRPGSLQKTIDIIGDSWTPLIIAYMLAGPATFSELEKHLIGISPRTLSNRLDILLTEKIIQKKPYNTHPPRNLYGLTAKGESLRTALIELAKWS